MGIEISVFPSPVLNSNTYLIFEKKRIILVDPFWNEQLETAISRCAGIVDYIFLTHEHYDHISGAATVQKKYGCPVVASEACKSIIDHGDRRRFTHFEAFCKLQQPDMMLREHISPSYACQVDITFQKDMILIWQENEIYMRVTPGHSPGSSCILFNNKFIFSGDTILPGENCPTIFPDGSIEAFKQESLPYLQLLPQTTTVFPGHYMSFCLGKHPVITNNLM